MRYEESMHQADTAYQAAIKLFEKCDLKAAKEEFRKAFQTYRKCGNNSSEITDAAFYLAVCLVETANNQDQLWEAEDLLIRYARDEECVVGKIPRVCVLAKVYNMLGKTKLMRLVSKETIAKATNTEERAYALAGAVYAAIPGTTEAYQYANEALPFLQTVGTQSEALAIVLEGMARAVEHLAVQERLEYAYELAGLLKDIPPHPMLPTLYDAYMIISYIYTEQANWQEGLNSAIFAKNIATVTNDDLAVASTYNHIASLYDMMGAPGESAKAHFEALKYGVTFHGVDLLAYARKLKEVAEKLAQYGDFRQAVSAQLLSLRCLIDSDDCTYNQIRESIIMLQHYERNST